MKYRATDSFYTSETKQIHDKQEFDPEALGVSGAKIDELKAKGLIVEVPTESVDSSTDSATENGEKSDGAPLNKADQAPKNK